jgi:hypothetical protein
MINEDLFKRFCEARPEYGLQANESILYEVSPSQTVEGLCRAADQQEDKLLLAPEYASAWSAFVFHNPGKEGTAFKREFLKKMRDKEIQAAYERAYNDLVRELGEQLRGLPISDLQEIAATRRENARRKALSAEQLRELSRAENPRTTREELPLLYTPRGATQQITLSAEVLRTAGQPNSPLPLWDFKYLNTRYPGQINARMNAAEKPQYRKLPDDVTRQQVIAALRDRELARVWTRTYGADQLNSKIFQG